MAWGTIRKATDEDVNRLATAEAKYTEKYGIEPDAVDDNSADGFGLINGYSVSYLRARWRERVRRALREPSADGIAYGYVGYHVD
jgi:hypothetical protein